MHINLQCSAEMGDINQLQSAPELLMSKPSPDACLSVLSVMLLGLAGLGCLKGLLSLSMMEEAHCPPAGEFLRLPQNTCLTCVCIEWQMAVDK